ncbi:unnamed protein product [Blepharisma stoltei]|uniref:Sodium/calcium exchanger membrane region domain-containing protein n=1 Tax=Blepharisma stoltei TaxID=1481888 RepID=A0AAU9JKT6_9CILI|nr:unnamed protein product [Blepharisma stoltei]
MAECEDVYNAKDHCGYTIDNCSWIFQFYFCSLNGNPFSLILMLILFWLFITTLGTIADQYFSPSLSYIASKLKLSPTLAGITLLAFGNGAPDVFSSILAAQKLKIFLALGALFGGALFVNSVVLYFVVIEGGESHIVLSKLFRDAGFLLLTVSTILIYGLIGEISLFQACLFPLLYTVYVCIVIYTEKEKKALSAFDSLELPVLESNRIESCEIIEDYIASTIPQIQITQVHGRPPHSIVSNLQWSLIKFRYFLQKEQTEFSSMTFFEKARYIIIFPIQFLQKLTIPYYIEENWNRSYAVMMPLASIFFVLTTQEWITETVFGVHVWIPSLIIGVFLCVWVWCTSKVSIPPNYNGVLTIVAFLMSILWICTICGYMVDLLSLAGLLSGIPAEFLGMTMLAWGNSAGDFYANPAIAKLGLNQTAMTACFAGPLFNTLVGFGIALIISSSAGPISFSMYDHAVVAISGCCLIASILTSLLFGSFFRGLITKLHAKLLLSLYFTFGLIVSLYQFT